MTPAETIKGHWVYAAVGIAAVSAITTWTIAEQVRVKAKDDIIELHKATIAELREKLRDRQQTGDTGSSAPVSAPAQPPSASSAEGSATVIGPIWIEESKPMAVFNDQVQIRISWPTPSVRTAVVDLELPSGELHWGVTPVGTTRTFDFKSDTYFFRIIEVSDAKAKIMITKKL